jgi:YggT family protein
MDVIVAPLIALLSTVVDLYIWVIAIGVVAGWLVHFRVINLGNQFVRIVLEFTYRATEPMLRPIRRILPDLGGIDVSPVVLILALYFAKDILVRLLAKLI